MIPKDVTLDSLMAKCRTADEGLAKLDATNREHRAFVISAIEKLVKDFILPAGDLPKVNSRFEIFDVDAAVGEKIGTSFMGVIEERIPPYLNMPTDEVIKAALDFIQVKDRGPEQRERFHRAWAANSAHVTIGTMAKFLKDPIVKGAPIPEDVLRAEKRAIEELRELPLPHLTKDRLDILLDYYTDPDFAGLK
jgi:hypothetical protein